MMQWSRTEIPPPLSHPDPLSQLILSPSRHNWAHVNLPLGEIASLVEAVRPQKCGAEPVSVIVTATYDDDYQEEDS